MNYSDYENIKKRHALAGFKCEHQFCDDPSTEIAHGISKGKYGRRFVKNIIFEKYGIVLKEKEIDEIIHSTENTWASCKKHNDSFNIHISSDFAVKHILKIYRNLYDTQ